MSSEMPGNLKTICDLSTVHRVWLYLSDECHNVFTPSASGLKVVDIGDTKEPDFNMSSFPP